MANTLANTSVDILSQKTLDAMIAILPRVKEIMSTDFSSEIANGGEKVLSRIPVAPESSEVPSGGYAAHAKDSTTKPVSVQLGNIEGVTLSFTEREWTVKQMDLMEMFISPAVNAVGLAMVNKVLAVCTAANVTSVVDFTGTFDTDSLVDVREKLVNQKARGNQFALLNPLLFNKLLKDPALKNANKSGSDQILKWARIEALSGFSPIMEYSEIPSSLKIAGVAGGKQGLCLAARAPADPGNLFTGELSNVTDPDSGFSIQLRKWYSADIGKYFLGLYFIMGAALGNKDALTRITYTAEEEESEEAG